MLPNIPNEVFETWLEPLIKEHGWNFNSIEDSTIDTFWYHNLGHDMTLKKLSDAVWQKGQIPINLFTPKEICTETLQNMIWDFQNSSTATSPRTTITSRLFERVCFQASAIETTGRLYSPIVLTNTPLGFQILDGYHRLCAIFILQKKDLIIDYWEAS